MALIDQPDLLILDEPTSGVDPVARDGFWEQLIELSRRDKVTIFVSTHFINEAQRCDRISLISAGKVLVIDTPEGVVKGRQVATLEDAFIGYLEEAEAKNRAAEPATTATTASQRQTVPTEAAAAKEVNSGRASLRTRFSLQRMLSYSRREVLELTRDPIRMTLAGLGSVILMIIMGYGITLDVEHLKYAVLDWDQTTVSRDYLINISGASRYFTERPPITDHEGFDRRMRSGELSMAIEIPPDFGRDVDRWKEGDKPVRIGVWIDGAMPQRETIRGYEQGMHLLWLQDVLRHRLGQRLQLGVGQRQLVAPATIELRYRYNPDVQEPAGDGAGGDSALVALDPGHAGDTYRWSARKTWARSSISTSRRRRAWESWWANSSPTCALGMINFLLLTVLAVTIFRVPLKGDILTAATGPFAYVGCSTASACSSRL